MTGSASNLSFQKPDHGWRIRETDLKTRSDPGHIDPVPGVDPGLPDSDPDRERLRKTVTEKCTCFGRKFAFRPFKGSFPLPVHEEVADRQTGRNGEGTFIQQGVIP